MPVGWLLDLPVGWVADLPVGWVAGLSLEWVAGFPVRLVPGRSTVAQYAVILSAPPAAVARLRKATDLTATWPSVWTCPQAVQSPNAAGPVASGPTAVDLLESAASLVPASAGSLAASAASSGELLAERVQSLGLPTPFNPIHRR